MAVKIIIVGMLLVIVYNLVRAAVYLVKDRGETTRTVKALSWRIGLSIGLLVLLVIGFLTGVIKPHSALPTAPQQQETPQG